ncbi:MAG: Ig-like domain-containing protein [Gemmatimonadales bacterium]
MMVAGDRQEAPAGEPLDDSLVVRLVDTAGSGVPGRPVTWVVSIGGGSVTPETDTTDADGFARTQWTLGPESGANAARAMVSGAAFVTFTAVGTGEGGGGSTPSAARSNISADPSSIPAVTGSSTITVTVRDGQGEPVEGASVSLEASGPSNTLTQPESATGPDGTTIGTLTGAAPGTITIAATVNQSVQLSQTAEVTVTDAAGPDVDHFVFRLQPHDVRKGERFRVDVALAAKDGSLVPLSGILMYLGLFPEGNDTPDNDLLSGNRFRETENGVAVFDDLSVTKKGRYRLRVLSDQLPELGPHGPEPYLFSVQFEVK